MNDPTTRDSVLRRKLAPRPATDDFAEDFGADFGAGLSPPPDPGAGALPRAFGRAISRATGLVAQGRAAGQRRASLAELLDLPDPLGFAALLSNGDGAPGLALVDAAGVTALIEALTIGAFARRPAPPRRPTATDGALIGELIDAILDEVDRNPDPVQPVTPGFRMGQPVAELRLLGLLLEDAEFTLDVVDFDLIAGEDGRRGMLSLALPKPAPAFDPFAFEVPDHDDTTTTSREDDDWQRALEASVLGAPAVLDAVLGRVRMPLAEVLELGVDSRIVLPLSQLEEVQIESRDHRPLALGRLGQYRAMRALRLTAITDVATIEADNLGEGAHDAAGLPDLRTESEM